MSAAASVLRHSASAASVLRHSASAASVLRHSASAAQTCASCANTKTCDCPCNVCVIARRRAAGHICLDCGEICGSKKCEDCDADPCMYCGDARCAGGIWCHAVDYDDDRNDPCDECKRPGCDGGMWCPANERDDSTDSEMEEMMNEQRAEEDRRFRSQMARRAAVAKLPDSRTITITLTGSAISGAGLMAAAAAAGAGGK